MQRRLTTAAALSAVLLLGACTEKISPPPPLPSYPKIPSDSPTASPQPSPAASDQKHADLLAVQDLYKAEFADENSVLKQGGADRLPESIGRRTSGPYKKFVLNTFRDAKRKGTHLVTPGKIFGVEMGTWTSAKVTFKACEDYSHVKTLDRHGKNTTKTPGPKVVQTYEVIKRDGAWRINDASGKPIEDHQSAPCDGKWYS